MDGQAVFKLAVGVLDSASRSVLAQGRPQAADIDWLIPHQANIRIMQHRAQAEPAARRVMVSPSTSTATPRPRRYRWRWTPRCAAAASARRR
jgi:3-oxoacyl-[acyl-carrier-protein] synthase III